MMKIGKFFQFTYFVANDNKDRHSFTLRSNEPEGIIKTWEILAIDDFSNFNFSLQTIEKVDTRFRFAQTSARGVRQRGSPSAERLYHVDSILLNQNLRRNI